FFFQAEDGIRDFHVTGVQTCALPICPLKFNQASNGFRFPAAFLQAPIIHNEDSLNEFLKSAPYHLSVNHIDETSIQTKIRAIVRSEERRVGKECRPT